MIKKRLLIIVLLFLLLISPVNAKMVTAKVDDKGLVAYGNTGLCIVGTLHTRYGTITVTDEDYNKVEINDTIRYNTDIDSFWHNRWEIEVIK